MGYIHNMKMIFPILTIGAMVLSGCGNDNAGKTNSTNATTATSAPTAPTNEGGSSLNYLGTLAAAQNSAVKTVDVASLNKALNEFNVQEGRFPKDLSELVPNYIAHVPQAPVGYKLDYNPTTGIVKVVPAQQ